MEDGHYWWSVLCLAFLFIIHAFQIMKKRRSSSGIGICPVKPNNPLVNKILHSPPRVPIIGHLHLLQGNPIIQMTKLAEKYGEIYSLRLGSVDSVVVTSLKLIRIVLTDRASHFGNRPNFLRYNILFNSNKDNSLAFCDWSGVQKTRRSLARRFCHSGLYADRMARAIERAGDLMVSNMYLGIEEHPMPSQGLKLNVQKACANTFFDFFCSEVYDDWRNDAEYEHIVKLFDGIFWEINQSHPTDVLPFLAPFYRHHLTALSNMGKDIRKFVISRVINPHLEKLDKDNPVDFVDLMLVHLEDAEPKNRLTLDQVLFELEDFIGGHSAVSNLLCRALVEIGAVPGLSQKIYEKRFIEQNKAYLQAVVYETLRKTSSPIVPHVASADSEIDGYPIKKGTMLLINNYKLNTSPEFWTDPSRFIPERFLAEDGTFRKPAHFFPFSYGKRACMGYQLVEKVTEGLLATIINNFDIQSMGTPNILPVASVAINPNEELRLRLIPRT